MTKASQPFSSWGPLLTRQLRGVPHQPLLHAGFENNNFYSKTTSKAAKNPDLFELNRFLYHLFFTKVFFVYFS